jgi:hypothetical protein
VSARESAHSDQANLAAVRRLIPPIPRLCFLAPSVTTLLFSTTVSQVLRQTLRGSVSEPRRAELPKFHLPFPPQQMPGIASSHA